MNCYCQFCTVEYPEYVKARESTDIEEVRSYAMKMADNYLCESSDHQWDALKFNEYKEAQPLPYDPSLRLDVAW